MTRPKLFHVGCLFYLLILSLPGCRTPEIIAEPTVSPTHTPSPPLPSPSSLPPTNTPTPTPTVIPLNTESEIIFTIVNDEPASGLAGDTPPDWLGWGAQAFTVGPDGSFWLLDTASAHRPRLLRFSSVGTLLTEIPLDDSIVGAVDVVVTVERVWVLGAYSQPPKVVAFTLDGERVADYPISTSPQPNNLWLSEGGELWITDPTLSGPYQFLDASGEVVVKHLEGYMYGGHLYGVLSQEFGQSIVAYVDEVQIEITPMTPNSQLSGGDWLGVMPNGGFYVAVWEEVQDTDSAIGPFRHVVHAYNVAGQSLGVALLPENAVFVDFNRDLEVGSNGELYALVSREDHSVDILRVGFMAQILPLSEATPPPKPTLLTPLYPAWTTPPPDATDLEIARETLLAFFTALHDGRYADAVNYYGGDYESLWSWDPDTDPNDYARLWEHAPLMYLLVSNIFEETPIAPNEFLFIVEFMWDDGTRFQFGPCCGASEADMPPVWQFPYTVKIIDGQMKVLGMPVYVP